MQKKGDRLKCVVCGNIFFFVYPDFQADVNAMCPYCLSMHYRNISEEERWTKTDRKLLLPHIERKIIDFFFRLSFFYPEETDKLRQNMDIDKLIRRKSQKGMYPNKKYFKEHKLYYEKGEFSPEMEVKNNERKKRNS